MRYRVIVQPEAQAEIGSFYYYLRDSDPAYADRWLLGLHEAISTLNELPFRCSFAPESENSPDVIRQLLYRWNRILYAVQGQSVRILHVRSID